MAFIKHLVGNRNKEIVLIIMIGLISIGLSGCGESEEPKREVIVFVLDDFLSEQAHGDLVVITIKKNSHSKFRIEKKDIFFKINQTENKYFEKLMEVLRYAKTHPNVGIVVNLSLGSYNYNLSEHLIIRELYNNEVVIVAAAGNDNTSRKQYPAAYKEVVGVAALDSNGRKEGYSNYGSHIDLAAEGFGATKILNIETNPRGLYIEEKISYLVEGGSSFATPRVVALFVEIMQRRPDISNAEVVKVVKETADPVSFVDLYSQHRNEGMTRLNGINPVKALCAADPEYRRKYELKRKILNVGIVGSCIIIGALVLYLPVGLIKAAKQDAEIRKRRLEELERNAESEGALRRTGGFSIELLEEIEKLLREQGDSFRRF